MRATQDYRQIISSLVKKPQAFRFYQLRDDLLPSPTYKYILAYLEREIRGKTACKIIVGLLHLAATYDCERELGEVVSQIIVENKVISLTALQNRFSKRQVVVPVISVIQHELASYEDLMNQQQEVSHG